MLNAQAISTKDQTTTQQWQKKGVVLHIDNQADWMTSHASFPKALVMPQAIRLFFMTRDKQNRGRIGYADLDKNNPEKILTICNEPVLDLGELGTFDDAGVTPSSVLYHDNKIFLYYYGWNAMQLTPHRLVTGLAISEDNGVTFKRYSRAPLFDRCESEPIFSNNPCVLHDEKGWHMWYLCLEKWVPINNKLEGLFTLYYAHSTNGIDWKRDHTIAIHKTYEHECVANATVIKEAGIYKMWYSYRSIEDFREGSGAYKIGYAESRDAIQWQRLDHTVNLVGPASEWDAVMSAFPTVVTMNDKRYMFYNGNGFGKTGVGLAIQC